MSGMVAAEWKSAERFPDHLDSPRKTRIKPNGLRRKTDGGGDEVSVGNGTSAAAEAAL